MRNIVHMSELTLADVARWMIDNEYDSIAVDGNFYTVQHKDRESNEVIESVGICASY